MALSKLTSVAKSVARRLLQVVVSSKDSVQVLRDYEPLISGQQISVLGHTISGVGGGTFYYDASDTTSADNNGTVIVTSKGERWKRPKDKVSSLSMFNQIGDGVEDNTIAINAMIDHELSANRKTVVLPNSSTFEVGNLFNTSQVSFLATASTFKTKTYHITDSLRVGMLTLPPLFTTWFTKSVQYSNGVGSASFDVTEHEIIGKTYYVRHTGGNDSNDGLTFATAFRTLNKATTQPDVDVVMLQSGVYDRNDGVWDASPTRSLSIKVLGGGYADLTGSDLGEAGSWSLTSKTYKRTRSAVESVWDSSHLDKYGDWLRLEKVGTSAAVDTTPNSWYTDGVDVWVRMIDDRAPDDDTKVQLSNSHLVTGPITIYAENINFASGLGFVARYDGGRPTVYANNCTFKYADVTGNFRSEGADSYLVDCIAAQGKFDGFNYHESASEPCRAFELNCVGRNNGTTGLGNNNGSTCHDAGGLVIRINCEYFGNEGPNCIDVLGASSFNLNVTAKDSKKSTTSRNFAIADTGDMYLAYCTSAGSSDFDVVLSGASILYTYMTDVAVTSGPVVNFRQFNPFA